MTLAILNEMEAAFSSRDADRVAALYAPDATFCAPGRPVVEGREAVAQMMAEDFRDPAFALTLDWRKLQLSASGDLAYVHGRLFLSFTNPQTGQVASIGGNYLQVMRQEPDGGWLVVEDISSPAASDERAS